MLCLIKKSDNTVVYVGYDNSNFPNSEDVKSIETLIEWKVMLTDGTMLTENNKANYTLEKWNNDSEKTLQLKRPDSEFYAKYDEKNELIGFAVKDIPVDLTELKKQKIEEMSKECNKEILAGFKSSCKGDERLYDFELENQNNLTGKLTMINTSNILGNPITSIEYYAKGGECESYTIGEFVQLCKDADDHKTSLIKKYKDLKEKIESLQNADDVKSIVW